MQIWKTFHAGLISLSIEKDQNMFLLSIYTELWTLNIMKKMIV